MSVDVTSIRQEWITYRRPARLIALAAAALSVLALGLLYALGAQRGCPGTCPETPRAADGSYVTDQFWFLHRDLGPEGSVTARLTSMTGTITYPPPDHDEIVSGLVPWAKTGIVLKDGLTPGSRYAAVMMTGGNGVRFQHDYEHDVAGNAGGVSDGAPRWLRLTRSGDTVTGAESVDGEQWHTVGTATLDGLPDVVRIGLFATSPGDLTVRGTTRQARFTQAVGVFDNVSAEGTTGDWAADPIGESNGTDWEKAHPSGAVRDGSTFRLAGFGDISPVSHDGAITPDDILTGLPFALLILVVAAARYGAGQARTTGAATVVVGGAAFVTGLLAVGVTAPVSAAILGSKGFPVEVPPPLTVIRVLVGVAAVLGLCAAMAYLIGGRLRRGWAAVVVAIGVLVVPYAIAILTPLPGAEWLLRLTPAAGFAVKQTMVEYPQVTAVYEPWTGYFPLPWWAGFLVLCGWAAVIAWATSKPAHGRPGQGLGRDRGRDQVSQGQ
ncbi:hypothetical protein AB0M02_27880 [Actinoplanes sp. NPDC051861]|uniref:hypothetical protein n=1 Tax=Actinoplanes sp. NPDC051861 TaxID=3155170 RepID=UPI003439E138